MCLTKRGARSQWGAQATRISRRTAAFLIAFVLAGQALAADRSSVIAAVPGQPYFFQLAPMFVPVIDKNNVTKQVSIAIAIEIADGGLATKVEEHRAQLDDAFLRDIYVFVQQRGGVGPPAGQKALKERLRQSAQKIIDFVPVTEIEIEEFFQKSR
jgi:flagellar basal body-associated protein FliL